MIILSICVSISEYAYEDDETINSANAFETSTTRDDTRELMEIKQNLPGNGSIRCTRQ